MTANLHLPAQQPPEGVPTSTTVEAALRAPIRLLTVATVLSGAASLMHETLWMRFLSTALGSTVQAAAAVFAAFLVGLALGARLSGPLVDRSRTVIATYVFIEIAICVSAVGTGLLLHRLRERLPAVLGQSAGVSGMLLAFAVTLLFVLVPTLLMGATFPAVMASSRRLGARADGMVRLYAMNTLGAVAGTLVCGFYALPSLGVTGTLAFAGTLNVLAALLCVPLMIRQGGAVPSQDAEPAGLVAERAPFVQHQAWLYATSILSGASVLALEVVWSRVASFTLGNRIYAFSTLMAWVLALLSFAAWLSGKLVVRFSGRIPRLLVVLLLASAAGIVLSTICVNAWILWPTSATVRFPHSPAVVVLLRVLGMGFLLALFLIPLGCLFPIGLACLRNLESRAGSLSGRYYMWNTVGSVLGSLAAGFLAIPTLGSFACAASVGLLCAAGALIGCLPSLRREGARRPALLGAATALAALAAVPLIMPEQLHVGRPGERVVLRTEDEWGVFQLSVPSEGRLRVTNNRTELVFLLGEFSTSYVQEMQAHIASFMRPSARTGLVIGSGYGITAGALAENPQIEHIDAVEILPAMVAAADRFEPYNRAYHRNPRIRVLVDDGRHFLARTEKKYDIISLNVSDAHLPGASALFNADFYDVIKRHLGSDGVAVQHAFGTDIRLVLSTLKRSFRYLRAFPAYENGYNVAMSDSPLRPSREDVERLAAVPSMRRALAAIGIMPPADAWQIFSGGLPPSQLQGLIDPHLVSSDDRPLLEFSRSGDPLSWFFSND